MEKTFYSRFGTFTFDVSTNAKMAAQFERTGHHYAGDIETVQPYINPGSVVIDIGAHVGTMAIPMARYAGTLMAFEPMKENQKYLEMNIIKNAADNIIVFKNALGARKGTVSMSPVDASNTGSNTVRGPGDIPMETLDSYYFDNVSLIKIDVEGYEPDVLAGAGYTIEQNRPVVFFELFLPALRKRYKQPLALLEDSLPGYEFVIDGKRYRHLWHAAFRYMPKFFLFNRGGIVLNVLALPR